MLVAIAAALGILSAADAVLARDHGADGLIVSNHGGRQLDGAVAPLRVLPGIVRAVWRKAGREGLLNPMLPEPYGGGGDFGHAAVLLEEIARTGASGLGFPLHSDIVAPYIHAYGSKAQKDRWLPRMAAGELIGAIAMTEPGAGSDLKSVRTTARREGDHYVLNGSKRFITNAPLADVFTVIARTGEGSTGSEGLTAFFVERSPGLVTGQPYRKMGQAGSPVSDVHFQDCRVPADQIIGGREGQGFKTVMKVLNKQRLHLAALCTGPAIRMLDLALAHVRQREQFGQPVANFQLVQAMLADSRTEIFAAQSMILEAARARDRGEDVALSASMCKYFASDDPAPIRQLREEHAFEIEDVNRILLRMLSELQVQPSPAA